MAKSESDLKESLVVCQSNQGVEIRGVPLRLTRYAMAFEIYNPNAVLRTSETLADLRITLRDRAIYSGRGVITSLVHTGAMIVCEVKLEESGFCTTSFAPEGPAINGKHPANGAVDFGEFLGQWQKVYKVVPEFKVVIADMQTFLMDLRLWLEQIELETRAAPAGDRIEMERQRAHEVGESLVPAFNALHERLEDLSERIDEELRPVHQNFAGRSLHPLVMCSPFAYRTFTKPLGYAGDYEMVNMITRDPYEGGSLFARVVNLWFLSQWPAKAHRNRIIYLKELLAREALRGARRGRPIRILNLGCGPAVEIQEFLAQNALSDHTDFTLLDFNEETISHTTRVLDEKKRQFGRRTPIHIMKKSVHQVLKESARPLPDAANKKFDLVYCAGLFDYLPDRTCKQLIGIFYDWLAPGGLTAATNVVACKPFRHMLEFVLDWHLIYREEKRGSALLPDFAPPENKFIHRDTTEVNLFMEVRKPDA